MQFLFEHDKSTKLWDVRNVNYHPINPFSFQNPLLTCPATANPSASKEAANQICKQTWNAAIVVGPCLAANAAARVTQNVAAITLTNNKNPDPRPKNKVMEQSTRNYFL